MKPTRYICVHGHFYQPPRENAWLEVIETQDSAAPFHDWNDRINFECYAPNTAARILGEGEQIVDIINNYERISFNFGPTLLSWLEHADPASYRAIQEADRKSMERFGGHGSAMAQVYNHLIMPLANYRDKETQVIWGIRDFERRFGRKPEGMWLAETAVDTETLEVLAAEGIQFTVLAPRQAKAVKAPGEDNWQYVSAETVDTRRPYRCLLPSGKSIALFFYHGDISQGVAFSGLLNDGARFASALMGAFDESASPQLAHIATDGESYGHHHRFGEMALAACLQHLEDLPGVALTNYSQYLNLFPPDWEAQVHDNSSWSCVHGVERWRANCGCNSGGRPGWTQEWRKPLRELLNWLRDQLIPLYERQTQRLLKDPWAARNDYIEVLLYRSEETIEAFWARHARQKLKEDEQVSILRLLEMQRNAMLMFTSCGWFFDEISGMETDQILQYANRAIHYAEQVAGIRLHNLFLQRLEQIPSNVYADGSVSSRQNVMSARADLVRVGMHYAASSLFEEYPEKLAIFNYFAESEVFHRYEAGIQRLAIGRTRVTSRVTQSEKLFSFAVLYLGQLNFLGQISVNMTRSAFDEMAADLIEDFKKSDLGRVIEHMETHFGEDRFSFRELFRDEKRKIFRHIGAKSSRLIDTAYREIYEDSYQLMTIIQLNSLPLPEAFQNAAQHILNQDMVRFFSNGSLNIRELKRLASEFKKWGVTLANAASLQLTASERIYSEIQRIEKDPEDRLERLLNLNQVLHILDDMAIAINFWKSQNLFFSLLQDGPFGKKDGDSALAVALAELGTLLGFRASILSEKRAGQLSG
ncbi:MAG: DUF3536 domain-containing protein [Haliscomenobacter sp.]|nr:DUF3536 domain-containing protein [Haliscomenobacter sp.]